MCVKWTKDLYN